MKRTLLTATLIACSLALMAQKKKADTTTFNLSTYSAPFPKLQPTYSIVFTGGDPKPIISMDLKKDGQPAPMGEWDTMIMHFKKSQFRWLNDSTAVYIRK